MPRTKSKVTPQDRAATLKPEGAPRTPADRRLPAVALILVLFPSVGDAQTSPASFLDKFQVHRIQLEVHTSKRKGADTDSWVRVSLAPNVDTYLDLPGDDFERGATRRYDLMVPGNARFRRLEDIQFLEIHKEGKANDWAITRLKLVVNNDQVVYEETFESRMWLGSYTVSGAALRASPGWRDFSPGLPLRMTREEIQERFSAVVGHLMHESEAFRGTRWGDNGSGVHITWVADDTVRVRLDLLKVINNRPNPDFDLRFDIRSIQLADRLEVRVVSATELTTNGPVAWIGTKFEKGEYHRAQDRAREMFRPFFEVTASGLERLRQAGVPKKVVEALVPLQDNRFTNRDLFVQELAGVLGPGQLGPYQEAILAQAFHDPGLLLSTPFPKIGQSGSLKFYIFVARNGDVQLEFGDDPMARIREEWARTWPERRKREEERRREERRKRNQHEP